MPVEISPTSEMKPGKMPITITASAVIPSASCRPGVHAGAARSSATTRPAADQTRRPSRPGRSRRARQPSIAGGSGATGRSLTASTPQVQPLYGGKGPADTPAAPTWPMAASGRQTWVEEIHRETLRRVELAQWDGMPCRANWVVAEMGVVFRAFDADLGRSVAVKLLLHGGHSGQAQVERFLREARAGAGLDHPNLVRVTDIGRHEGQVFFTMDLVDGPSVADVIRQVGRIHAHEACANRVRSRSRSPPCAPLRHHPSRSKAREPAARRAGPDAGHGFRIGEACFGRRTAAHRHGPGLGDARVHGPRASAWTTRDCAQRRLLAGSGPVRDAVGKATVFGGQRRRCAAEGGSRRAPDRAIGHPEPAHRPGLGMRDRHGEGSGPALPHSRGARPRPRPLDPRRARAGACAHDLVPNPALAAPAPQNHCGRAPPYWPLPWWGPEPRWPRWSWTTARTRPVLPKPTGRCRSWWAT